MPDYPTLIPKTTTPTPETLPGGGIGVTPPLVKNCTLRRAAGQGMAGSEGT